jgi:hypothetical protein
VGSADNLTTLKSGSLNLVEPCGPVQVCNGTALPLPYQQLYIILKTHSILKTTDWTGINVNWTKKQTLALWLFLRVYLADNLT